MLFSLLGETRIQRVFDSTTKREEKWAIRPFPRQKPTASFARGRGGSGGRKETGVQRRRTSRQHRRTSEQKGADPLIKVLVPPPRCARPSLFLSPSRDRVSLPNSHLEAALQLPLDFDLQLSYLCTQKGNGGAGKHKKREISRMAAP